MSASPPLRVGLLLDDWTAPRWVEDIVRALLRSPAVHLALVIRTSPPGSAGRKGRLVNLWRMRRTWAFDAYRRLDARLFACPDDPFAPRDLRPLLDDVPQLTVRPIRTSSSDRFADADLGEIAPRRLDVALGLGSRTLRGAVLDIAPHGIWSFHQGNDAVGRRGPGGAWEVFENRPTTSALLEVLTESPEPVRVLGRVSIATDPRSVHRNRCALIERAWPMMPRLLESLQATGRLVVEPARLSGDPEHQGAPSSAQTAGGLVRLASRYVRDRVTRAVTSEQWQLGYDLGAGCPEMSRFRAIEPPVDRFWADPFPVESDDGHVVFFEELIYPANGERPRGWISSLRIGPAGEVGPVAKVLEAPHHLSYPLVFSWRNDWYMLPESAEANNVVLYRSTRFPDAWERCAVLLDDCAGLDNTLAEIDGSWWLWVTLKSRGPSPANETMLFHAESPLGPFVAHPRNPVATDIRNARGAGRPFVHEGHWIRPAQDGSGSYGRAIVFMRIDQLDLDHYAESEISRIEPRWDRGIVATHTYNRAGKLQMIDFVKRRFRLGWTAR